MCLNGRTGRPNLCTPANLPNTHATKKLYLTRPWQHIRGATSRAGQMEGLSQQSVDLLHLRSLIGGPINLLKWWKVVVVSQALVVIVNAQAKFDHAMNASCKLCGLVEVEAGSEKGRIEEQPDQVLHSLVRLVCCRLLLQFRHDAVLWVDLHSLLRDHV